MIDLLWGSGKSLVSSVSGLRALKFYAITIGQKVVMVSLYLWLVMFTKDYIQVPDTTYQSKKSHECLLA